MENAQATHFRVRAGILSLLSLAILLGSASAQTPSSASSTPSAQDLAKEIKNPIADAFKFPLQFTTGFNVGSHHRTGEGTNFQPLLPMPLSSRWDLILRPNINLVYAPSPHQQFGFQDLQTSVFLTPATAEEWIWGLGPVFQFPTASTKSLGTGRWSAGPTGALIYNQGPWFNAIMSYQLMSFAGDRNRGSVNQTYIEPLISYNTESGWSIQCDPQITFDWTSDAADAWSIPIGADVGKAFSIGDKSLGLQVGVYDYLKSQTGSPAWIVRAQITAIVP